MKVKTTKTMAKTLQQYFKDYKITQEKLTERQFIFNVSIDAYNHENDFDYITNKYNVLKVTYPNNYYACNRYLTTNDLIRAYDNSDKTFNGFIKAIKQEIEI